MTSPLCPTWIAVDWGTTHLRAWAMAPDGILAEATSDEGMGRLAATEFEAALLRLIDPWLGTSAVQVIACGMVGSRQGWHEAPYRTVPCAPVDPAALVSVPTRDGRIRVAIAPGLKQPKPADVMRGEETQIAGALALNPALREGSLLVMPGTHSKWVSIEQGRIARFDTYMTGELFAVLRGHSILGRFARDVPKAAEDAAADAAFLRGVQAVREGGQVAPLLFSARALVLTGGLRPELSLDYLSGLLIGEELLCGLRGRREGVVLIGDPALCRRYREALALLGVSEVREIENAATAGLWRIAIQAGLAAGISEETV